MKNFMKKYPKRLITALLVVLLIAVVGTVNNYRTYRTFGIDEKLYNFLIEIYSDVDVKNDGCIYANFDELKRCEIYPDYVTVRENLSKVNLTLNDDEFSADDTLTVTITNLKYNYVEVYKNLYKVQFYYDGEWYTLRRGEFVTDEQREIIRLKKGESYEFAVPLEYISEFTDESVKMLKGKYRICTQVELKSDREDIGPVKTWLGCEFEIK